MPYSQPRGYRLPSSLRLPLLARWLEQYGWPTWRTEVVSTLAAVCHELLVTGRPDEVYARLSHDQVSRADLPLSTGGRDSVITQAAEFIDVAHGLMAMPSARPVSPSLDLRCQAQFMDDPDDPEGPWTYVLFGTQRAVLHQAFLDMEGVEAYPVEAGASPEEDAPDRAAVWDRVLAPYARFMPLSVSAPEPQVLFDIVESRRQGPEQDEVLAAEGKVTISAVVEACARLGTGEADGMRERLLAPAPG
ncbi:hypothetical protein [Serinicoccus kebangsaanensis]|uniref:hypothetical protein n=1 Tax=Serinicoccus kebangsaanensis TaxID=2602069 RepID=UPI00124C636E|nr:hypothetical protein [Serinicoccus kebangsaanensis]